MSQALPLIVAPEDLEERLGSGHLLIVDLSRPETYAQTHLPGAVHLDYAQIVTGRPPAVGLLPDTSQLSRIFSAIGLTPEDQVVAYDDEGGGRASRLLWTLDAVGHRHYALLDGGLHAWYHARRPLTDARTPVIPGQYPIAGLNADAIADKAYILRHLADPGVALVDARTPEEYRGQDVRAHRGGHIPGAVSFNWVNAMDRQTLRLKPPDELERAFAALDVTPEREVVTYCQTHHRSAHTYIVLKSLGYARVRGYPGSWSEWGNSTDTPVE